MNKFSNFKIHWCICSHCQKRTDKYKIKLAYRPIILAAYPLTTARDRHWWSHWRFQGSPDISTSFLQGHSNKEQ